MLGRGSGRFRVELGCRVEARVRVMTRVRVELGLWLGLAEAKVSWLQV